MNDRQVDKIVSAINGVKYSLILLVLVVYFTGLMNSCDTRSLGDTIRFAIENHH